MSLLGWMFFTLLIFKLYSLTAWGYCLYKEDETFDRGGFGRPTGDNVESKQWGEKATYYLMLTILWLGLVVLAAIAWGVS